MKLIVGLGNPGKQYENTRHNVGFMVIDKYILNNNLIAKEKFGGIYYEENRNGEKYIFLKPQKYINLSGMVIKQYIDFFKINIEEILIIHDDLDLPVGSMKIKLTGGSGGHNGLKDIENQLKTKNYKRVKIGISNNKQIETKDYVLGKFGKDDFNLISENIDKSIKVINEFGIIKFENIMNKYN